MCAIELDTTLCRCPRPDPCHYCGTTAHFRDDDGHPVHKVCLEQAITTEILAGHEGRFAA